MSEQNNEKSVQQIIENIKEAPQNLETSGLHPKSYDNKMSIESQNEP